MVKFIAAAFLPAAFAAAALAQITASSSASPSSAGASISVGSASLGASASLPSSSNSTAGAVDNGFGKCGALNQGFACPDSTHCCSKYGFCGLSDYCGDGCQGGPCTSGPIQLKAPPASATATTSTTASPSVNPTTPTSAPASPPVSPLSPESSARALSVSSAGILAAAVVAARLN